MSHNVLGSANREHHAMKTPKTATSGSPASDLFADVLAFTEDQSRQFLECAKHQTDRDNRGAEAVALRASEILDLIAAYIRSANRST